MIIRPLGIASFCDQLATFPRAGRMPRPANLPRSGSREIAIDFSWTGLTGASRASLVMPRRTVFTPVSLCERLFAPRCGHLRRVVLSRIARALPQGEERIKVLHTSGAMFRSAQVVPRRNDRCPKCRCLTPLTFLSARLTLDGKNCDWSASRTSERRLPAPERIGQRLSTLSIAHRARRQILDLSHRIEKCLRGIRPDEPIPLGRFA